MMNLLFASLNRLRKNLVFWLGMFIMFGMAIFLIMIAYFDMQSSGNVYTLEERLFWYAILIGVILSIFCSLFIGTEYSDGTMRNQLVIGHRRIDIYFANLLTCIVAGLALCIAYLIPSFVLGTILLGFFEISIQSVLVTVLCSFALTIAYVSLFTFIAMCNQNKATVAIISILVAFSFFYVANYIGKRLSEPKMYRYAIVTEEYETNTDQEMLNPHYLEGMHRKVYETFDNLLPGNQAMKITQLKVDAPWQMIMYDGIIFIITTSLGIYLFQRKDIQ